MLGNKKANLILLLILCLVLSTLSFPLVSASSVMWSQTYGSNEEAEMAYSLVETSDGGYAIAGGAMDIGVSYNFWLVKTDENGSMQWNQKYGGSKMTDERARSLVETSDGGYALAGDKLVGADMNFWVIKTNELGIIPEFPSWTLLPILIVSTFAVIIIRNKIRLKPSS